MSLSTKLGLAMGGGVLLACLFVTVGVVLRAVEAQGTAREHEIRAYAQVLAASLSEVMDADGHADLYRRLSSIRDARGVGFAEVVDTRGQRIAHVGMQAVLLDTGDDWASYFPALGDLLRARTLVAEAAIRRSGETVGLVRLAGEAPGAGEALNREFRSAAAWALFALMFGALCSFLLQRRIVDPIRQLTTRMSAAERRGALPGALTMSGTGEIGVLVTAYNRMIGEIAIRDEELGQHRLHLENLVDERTAELRAARDEAEQATEAKSRFLATMSHEIRTPMNGLLVMAEMLERTRLPASSKTYVSTIARCGRSMMDILNDILDFSKLEAERLELESIPFSPDDLANDVLRLFWEQARSKGIELTGFIAPDVPAQLLGDPTRLRQCISNLVGNAIKFTETGHVSLNIERASETLSIAVCDTGAGIPQDRLSTIFQAFTQADQSTTRRHGGTGLGLNIAAQLVAAMGGEIGVESTIGEGSTFCMTLPCLESTPAASRGAMPPVLSVTTSQPALGAALGRALGVRGIGTKGAPAAVFVDADAPGEAMPGVPRIGIWDFGCEPPMAALADGRLQDILPLPYTRAELDGLLARIGTGTLRGTAAISTEAEASDALAAFEGLRVLVADDSPLNHDVMIEALGALGIEPTLVSDGRAALDAIGTGAFDFAFIDGEMPELDGFSVAAEARRLGTTTRLILFSAHTVGVTVGKEAMDCFDGVLTKPFGLSQLESVLRDGNAQETERVAAPAAEPESPTGSVFDAALMAQLDRLDERRPGAKLRVLDTFATALPTAIEALRETLASGCRDESRKSAHALKSISLSAGAERIGKAAAALENRLSAGDVPQAESDAVLATLMAERDAALAELARMQVAQAA